MALIVKDALIRKKDGTLPAGSSGFFVSISSVFLFGLLDGDKIIGEIKEGEETKEIMRIRSFDKIVVVKNISFQNGN